MWIMSNVDNSQIYIIDSLAFKGACVEKAIQFQLVNELISKWSILLFYIMVIDHYLCIDYDIIFRVFNIVLNDIKHMQ